MLTFTFAAADAAADDAQIAQRGAQPLAVHVDLGVVAVHVEHRPFETQRADRHPDAGLDRRVRCCTRPAPAQATRSFLQPADDLLDGRPRIGARRTGLAGADRRRGAARRLIRQRRRARLQALDDRVDLAAAFAQLLVQLRVEPAPIRVFALAHGVLARPELAFGVGNRGPLARDLAAILLEPPDVLVHAGEMLGQLLLAIAQALPRLRHDRRRHAQTRGDLDGQAAPGRSVLQANTSARRSPD